MWNLQVASAAKCFRKTDSLIVIIVSDLCSSDAKISSIIVVCVKFVSFIEKVTIRYIRKMLGSARTWNSMI